MGDDTDPLGLLIHLADGDMHNIYFRPNQRNEQPSGVRELIKIDKAQSREAHDFPEG